jgi:alkylated DNA repair dioxygenase AlkB
LTNTVEVRVPVVCAVEIISFVSEDTMASKKKGLSLEEKRKKMMEIFFETKDVYLLKGKNQYSFQKIKIEIKYLPHF